ncbi:MAG: NAD(P)-dependent oxidoreductase [Marinifilaceae bacterium]|nr:NAD(P)-dependent oxidoreductase [Marinifilaceae bacterium]
MKILVTYKIPTESFAKLGPEHTVTMPEGEYFTTEELIRLVPDYDVILGIFTRPIENSVIDAGKNLKLISNFGVGFNNIDIKYARSKGVAVCNTPKAVCFPTAEMTMGLMLSAARRITECDRRLRVEKESMWGVMKNLGFTLEGRTLGIIGMGNIGKTVAEMAKVFRMHVIYHNQHSTVEGYEKVDLDTLLRRSDYISLHTPLTESTRHLIGKRELELMKPTAILINTARGPVVDEATLAECLQHRRIAGAALDVFEAEPHITEILYKLDNVVLAPHNATGTIDTRIATGQEAVDNILNFFNGTPTNVVNR